MKVYKNQKVNSKKYFEKIKSKIVENKFYESWFFSHFFQLNLKLFF